MDLSKKKQNQTAEDYAVQNQIEGQDNLSITQVNYNYGVTSSDVISLAKTVYEQLIPQTIDKYSIIAETTVNDRLDAFGRELLPRIIEIEGALDYFKDPKFQFLLRDAQRTAAKTDRIEDLNLLSELLTCHVAKGNDRKIDAGIHHAIKIVDEIDNDALCALSVACAFQYYVPNKGSIREGLKDLDNAYKKLIYLNLPEGLDWLEHLDMLGALRLSPLKLVDSKEYIVSQMKEYVCVGIKNNSEEQEKAFTILDDNHISRSVLIENECMDGYKRLKIGSLKAVNLNFLEAVNSIMALYTKDKLLLHKVKDSFVKLWDSYEALRTVRNWWSRIPTGFDITYVGRVLAHTNAKRIDSTFPDIFNM